MAHQLRPQHTAFVLASVAGAIVLAGLLGLLVGIQEPTPIGVGSPVIIRADTSGPDLGLINQSLLGVVHTGPRSAVPALSRIPLAWVRTDVAFQRSYDCSSGAWSPQALDGTLAQIRAEHASPILIVDYTPTCLAPNPKSPQPSIQPPDATPASQRIWDRLVSTMATNAIQHGTRVFEVWNEPDGEFWSGTVTQYLYLYRDTVGVMERTAGVMGVTIRVGGPALVTADQVWLRPFLAFVAGHRLPLDFLSWHFYSNDPLGTAAASYPAAVPFQSEVQEVKADLTAFPSLHPELWVDEWNAANEGSGDRNSAYVGAVAAALLVQAQQSGVGAMAFYEAVDSPLPGQSDLGLLQAGLDPKPVYYTFLYWHMLALEQIAADIGRGPEPDSADEVGAIATKNPAGAVAILVYNVIPGAGATTAGHSYPTTHLIDLVVSGLQGSYLVAKTAGDGPRSAAASVTARRGQVNFSFDLYGDSVALVTLTPRP